MLRACPDDRLASPCWRVLRTDPWMPQDCEDDDLQVFSAFWMTAAHALYFLDFYLNDADALFDPAFPHFDTGFGDDWKVQFPSRALERDELLAALAHGRDKARRVLPALTDEQQAGRMPAWHPHAGKPFADLVRENLDHLAEHTAHLEAVARG